MQTLRVGFLSFHDHLDRNAWSGTLFYMQRALKARDIQVVSLREAKKISLGQKILQKISRYIGKNNGSSEPKIGSVSYLAECHKLTSVVEKKLAQTPCDVIFAPVASRELMFHNASIPIIYLSDVTFSLYRQLYEVGFDKQECDWASKEESIAISKASKLFYSSQWAADSAISDYQAEAQKIEIIPFGANLDTPPLAEEALAKKPNSTCRLLLIGKDWYRKGGDIAFQTLISLLQKGVDAELVVVGCVPPAEIKHDKLIVIPYLNKNVPQERKKLDKLFLSSHFFILPTRADCSPIVTCEANAFGLPVLTTDVGGIPTIIKEGKNGYMLSLSASGDAYADLIIENFSEESVYDNLRHSSRKEYETRLNWDKWAERFHHEAIDLLNQTNLQREPVLVERLAKSMTSKE